ncbi:hypothetical protein AVEN_201580-1 [Araneus ventricosus]|uniref:Uncharacterized protein n=1 Tax=Araneus ventricosus TaxID=182803 RepID=A0A4Y2FGF8_ARAVE|nr:hypothetical protein AVEN_201580-1 [Araneus ventricosus]
MLDYINVSDNTPTVRTHRSTAPLKSDGAPLSGQISASEEKQSINLETDRASREIKQSISSRFSESHHRFIPFSLPMTSPGAPNEEIGEERSSRSKRWWISFEE